VFYSVFMAEEKRKEKMIKRENKNNRKPEAETLKNVDFMQCH